MTIYFFTIILLFVFSLLEENYKISNGLKNGMMLISFTLLVLQVGLRWETGTDWDTYLRHFESFSGVISVVLGEFVFEYGYGISVWLFKLLSSNYSIFLLLHAIIYYILIYKSFKHFMPNMHLTLLMYYTLSIGMMGSNRQLIALAICIYAVRFVMEKKTVLFFLLIIIASFFHTTAIFFIIYYFLNRKIDPVVVGLILVSAIIIGKAKFPFIVFSSVGNLFGGMISFRATSYAENAKDILLEHSLSTIGLIKRLVFFFFFYYNRKQLSAKLAYYNLMLNGYFVGIVVYFLFADSLLIIVNRGSLYFNIMEPLLIASQIYLLKDKTKILGILIMLIMSIFFFYQSISLYPEIFEPYKGIFINSDIHRTMR